jgi:uncharacterized protein YprB with RNaseH-like and TPR domain
MVSEELKRRISLLQREDTSARGRHATGRKPSPTNSDLVSHFPEGSVCATERGDVFVCETPLGDVYSSSRRLRRRYLAVFKKARRLARRDQLPAFLDPLVESDAEGTVLVDTETVGFHGRPLFMIGMVRHIDDELVLTQYFARSYAEEAGILERFAALLPEVELLISFNGKAFDWPFVRDRMIYHRLACEPEFDHLDLLHPSRRRWRSELPNCKLQTLERYLCGRWRSGDIPGEEIPQRYHDFVREQDARLVAPIFHHNRLDLITMMELLIALLGSEKPVRDVLAKPNQLCRPERAAAGER